jgi:hypothetical protein
MQVKCNGLLPCDRCTRTNATCVYDKPQQKKDTSSANISKASIAENHEPRLKKLQQFLRQFSNLLDNTPMIEPLLYSNPNQIHPNIIKQEKGKKVK